MRESFKGISEKIIEYLRYIFEVTKINQKVHILKRGKFFLMIKGFPYLFSTLDITPRLVYP